MPDVVTPAGSAGSSHLSTPVPDGAGAPVTAFPPAGAAGPADCAGWDTPELEDAADEDDDDAYEEEPEDPSAAVHSFVSVFAALLLLLLCLGGPLSAFWLYKSGDLGVERAVKAQSAGEFVLFGPGARADVPGILAYKLRLVAEEKPEIVLLGAGTGSMRGSWFSRPVTNMAGTVHSLEELKTGVTQLLAIHRPRAVLIGLDFRWFMENRAGEKAKEPSLAGYGFSLDALKRPWRWLGTGAVDIGDFFRPLTGSVPDGLMGLSAWSKGDGFGPQGSFYRSSLLTKAEGADPGFARAVYMVKKNIGPYAVQTDVNPDLVDLFAETYYRLRAVGIRPIVYMCPVATTVLTPMRLKGMDQYPHLFRLADILQSRGIDVTDMTDAKNLDASDCEFMDAVDPGEVTGARILRQLTNRRQDLLGYVFVERLNRVVMDWGGHAGVRDPRVTNEWEIDFLNLSCVKKTP